MKLILGDATSRRAKLSQKGKEIIGVSWSGRATFPVGNRFSAAADGTLFQSHRNTLYHAKL
ncbi:MAG TPA: hypothetical protein VM735_05855 [Candidatus Kapabacteria bacterium]|nr:hypothetical protein [Candidatus Kapabacteria bacterium]